MARSGTTMLHKGNSGIVNISCLEDKNWDEYGVHDALQHNLLADGNYSVYMDTSTECSAPSIISAWASTSPKSISASPEVKTWINTVDNNYCSIPFNNSELLGQSTLPSSRKRSPPSPPARPVADTKPKKTTTYLPTSRTSPTCPPNMFGSGDTKNSSLFPCPFYHHDPAKYSTQLWRSCMGPGWTIPRLKEHIYRRHCLPEHACQRCLAEFDSQSELADHEKYPRCPVLSDSASGKIGKSKKDRIRPRRAKMPDYEKWVVIYRILFDSDPVRASPSYTQSSESSQPTESPETLTSFEHYLRTRKRLDGSESASEQVQTCLDLIQEWREEHNAPRPRQASRNPPNVPHGGFTLIDASQLSQNEEASWPGVGNEDMSLDRSFMDELCNTYDSDQWLWNSFSYEPPGDVLWEFG